MSSSKRGLKEMKDKKASSSRESDSQVEELLRIAEDEMFLQLKLNTHTSSITTGSRNSPIHPDLARRFDALKSPNIIIDNDSISAPPKTTAAAGGGGVNKELMAVLGPDLSARFSSLKFHGQSNPFIANSTITINDGDTAAADDDCESDDDVDDDGISKREVDKLIEWAKDAARLDPSLTDGDGDGDGDGDDDDDDDDSDDQDEEQKNAKRTESTRK